MKTLLLVSTFLMSSLSFAGDACQILSLNISSNYCYKISCAVMEAKDVCTQGYPSQEEVNKLYPRAVKYLIDAGFTPSGQDRLFIKK